MQSGLWWKLAFCLISNRWPKSFISNRWRFLDSVRLVSSEKPQWNDETVKHGLFSSIFKLTSLAVIQELRFYRIKCIYWDWLTQHETGGEKNCSILMHELFTISINHVKFYLYWFLEFERSIVSAVNSITFFFCSVCLEFQKPSEQRERETLLAD